MIYKALHLILNVFFAPFISMTIQNKENIPKDKNYIIVSNHVSNFDPLLLALAWSKPLHFMAKQELFNIFIIGRVLKIIKMIPVRRGESDRKAVKEALQYLNNGEILALFPEGTRNKNGKGLLPFHGGAAFFAKTSDLAVLPVAISGTAKIRPSFFNRVNFKVGRPIAIENYFEGKVSSKELEEFTQIIKSEIERLLGDTDESN